MVRQVGASEGEPSPHAVAAASGYLLNDLCSFIVSSLLQQVAGPKDSLVSDITPTVKDVF